MLRFATLTDTENGQAISDHFPVIAEIASLIAQAVWNVRAVSARLDWVKALSFQVAWADRIV
ncbi:hypothetical protein ACRAWD_00975 [Caulobacter segnis]